MLFVSDTLKQENCEYRRNVCNQISLTVLSKFLQWSNYKVISEDCVSNFHSSVERCANYNFNSIRYICVEMLINSVLGLSVSLDS